MNETTGQLDLFADSVEVLLRNPAIDALLAGDALAAQAAMTRLHAEYPDDAALAPLTHLMQGLREREAEGTRPFTGQAELRASIATLLDRVLPAAQQLLGAAGAKAWLRGFWRALAERAQALDREGESHAAPLWLAADDAAQAAQAVEGITSWRRIPAPLAWMLQARHRLEGLDAIWPLWTELAWMAPRRARELVAVLNDAALSRLVDAFDDGFDDAGSEHGMAWFPAWLLIDKPGLAPRLAAAEAGQHTAAEQALRLLVQLVGLERQGRQREAHTLRPRLRDLHAGLFACYLARR